MTGPLGGTLAAAVTPLRDGGATLDVDAFGPLVEVLVAGGADGIFALGTTGEGIMLSIEERQRATELFLAAAAGRIRVAVHCGAQTTADTVALATHAAEKGADAVAVIGPPYYPFDDAELLQHFRQAARACRPVPFYAYVLSGRSGYAIPISVLMLLRDDAPNFVGMKVSEAPFDRFEPYLLEDLDVLVGPEALIVQGLKRGAAGAVSALATVFPEVVSRLVYQPDDDLQARVAELRIAVEELPMPSVLKEILRIRGVPVDGDVRAPLRPLSEAERTQAAAIFEGAEELLDRVARSSS